jgi:DNA polymerase-3 subunit delta'
MTILPIFEDLTGQEHAAGLLSGALAAGPSHAYLFIGPEGTGRLAAALSFAAALCCESGGCGTCPSCLKAARATHPDIETISPAGSFVMVDQVREVNNRLTLRPYESPARVFIFEDACAFNSESANAFLKSLEEPPSFVYFVLLATRLDRVLPTIVSRCQMVRFSAVPPERIEERLLAIEGVRKSEALAYSRLADGNLALAMRLATDAELAARRRHYLEIAGRLSRGAWEGGPGELLALIEEAAGSAVEASGSKTRAAEPPAGFITATKKKVEDDAKRRLRSARQREIRFALEVFESWYRDLMISAAGAADAIVNRDYELELDDASLPSKLGSYRRALEAIRATRAKLGYNIDVELALTAMFLDLQEVL